MTRRLFAASLCLLFLGATARAEDAADLVRQAVEASDAGRGEQAVELLTRAVRLDPREAFAYYLRGREQFKLGRIEESVADFDQYVKLSPDQESRQWERGISLYYAGEYERGAAQFVLYQTYHDQDVENSVWRYLCVARSAGVEKARETMLPIRDDRRPPMMTIYRLYRGEATPEDVLAAADEVAAPPEARQAARFYAELYLGLYYEAAGDAERARQHLQAAAAGRIGHYMGDVAVIHAERLRKAEETP